jgi:hypothetical protein
MRAQGSGISPGVRRNPRIIFPDYPWFDVSSELYTSGLARAMTPAQFMRYVTLRHLANEARKNEVQVSQRRLDELDGISKRRSHEVHPHLVEMGLLVMERKKKPHKYILLMPSEWKIPVPRRTSQESKHGAAVTRVTAPAWVKA